MKININVLIACWSGVWSCTILAFGNLIAERQAFAVLLLSHLESQVLHKLIFYPIIIWAIGLFIIILIHWLFGRFSR